MLGIEKELSVFYIAFLDGIIISLVYGVIRVFRRTIGHSLFWIALEDALFWIGTAIYLFWEICRMCEGSLRWYFVVSVLLGGIISSGLIQKLIKKYIDNSLKTR